MLALTLQLLQLTLIDFPRCFELFCSPLLKNLLKALVGVDDVPVAVGWVAAPGHLGAQLVQPHLDAAVFLYFLLEFVDPVVEDVPEALRRGHFHQFGGDLVVELAGQFVLLVHEEAPQVPHEVDLLVTVLTGDLRPPEVRLGHVVAVVAYTVRTPPVEQLPDTVVDVLRLVGHVVHLRPQHSVDDEPVVVLVRLRGQCEGGRQRPHHVSRTQDLVLVFLEVGVAFPVRASGYSQLNRLPLSPLLDPRLALVHLGDVGLDRNVQLRDFCLLDDLQLHLPVLLVELQQRVQDPVPVAHLEGVPVASEDLIEQTHLHLLLFLVLHHQIHEAVDFARHPDHPDLDGDLQFAWVSFLEFLQTQVLPVHFVIDHCPPNYFIIIHRAIIRVTQVKERSIWWVQLRSCLLVGVGLRAQQPRSLVDELLELTQPLLDYARCGARHRNGLIAQLLQSMLVHSSLLAVVVHALAVAVGVHLRHYLLEVVLYVLPHHPHLPQSLLHLVRLDPAGLPTPLRLLLDEAQVLPPNVLYVLQHRSVEVLDGLVFSLITALHRAQRLPFVAVCALHPTQVIQKRLQLCPPSSLLVLPAVGRDGLHSEPVRGQMGRTLLAVVHALSLDEYLKLRLEAGVVDALYPGSERTPALGHSCDVGTGHILALMGGGPVGLGVLLVDPSDGGAVGLGEAVAVAEEADGGGGSSQLHN